MTSFPAIPDKPEIPKLELINQTEHQVPVEESLLLSLLNLFESRYPVHFQSVELVYVDENEIVRINSAHLQRDYVTDIISFQYHDNGSGEIEGTLFCCAPRIIEQSKEHGTPLEQEFYRIFIHGILHLCGFDDQTPEQKREMSALENYFLNKINL